MNEEKTKNTQELAHDLGNFEGYNFRDQCGIWKNPSADEVLNWDHDREGEAEFWPDGEHEGVALIFRGSSSVSAAELLALDTLLEELGDDSQETFFRVYFCISELGCDLCQLSASEVEEQNLYIFSGTSFIDLRRQAAYELFELYYPEEFAMWDASLCDGLYFDEELFLNSPAFSITEVKLGDNRLLAVAVN